MHPNELKEEFSWFRSISAQFIQSGDIEKLEKSSVKLTFKKG